MKSGRPESTHTHFVRSVAKADNADEAKNTLMITFRNALDEQGNVTFALHRSTDNPNELWIYETQESQE